jgi:hypothetical protein
MPEIVRSRALCPICAQRRRTKCVYADHGLIGSGLEDCRLRCEDANRMASEYAHKWNQSGAAGPASAPRSALGCPRDARRAAAARLTRSTQLI